MSDSSEPNAAASSQRNMLFGNALAATSALALTACGGASAQSSPASGAKSSSSVITSEMARKSITRTGEQGLLSCSATAGR